MVVVICHFEVTLYVHVRVLLVMGLMILGSDGLVVIIVDIFLIFWMVEVAALLVVVDLFCKVILES